MDKNRLTNIIGWSIIGCFLIIVAFKVISFLSALLEISQMKFYPEHVPPREVLSSSGFSLLWSKKTGEGSQYLVYTQIFAIDNGGLIYITPLTMKSVDYLTGDELWSTNIPEDSTFHFYDGKLFTLNSYDRKVPFMLLDNINIPVNCHSSDQSILRVYNPSTGAKEWEYSYQMVSPYEIYFNNKSAFIHGLTVSLFAKYISTFEVDIDSGQILGVKCKNYNDYSYPTTSIEEGILSSGFYPISRDWEWDKKTDLPAFIVDGSKLIQVDRRTKSQQNKIEFSGAQLNPDGTQLIIQDNTLVIYLDDSNQFFAFAVK